MEILHVNLATPERATLFPTVAAQLRAVRTIVRLGRGRIVLFCVVDDHVHLLIFASRELAGRIVRGLVQAWNRLLGTRLGPPFFRRVESRRHLEKLVPYVLDQTTHHEIRSCPHPALWPGSSFADLIGARRLPGFDRALLDQALPRRSEQRFYDAIGLAPLSPADDRSLRTAGLDHLVQATGRVIAQPRLTVRNPTSVRARRMLVRIARNLSFSDRQIAAALECPRRTVSHLGATACLDLPMQRALRLRVALDALDLSRDLVPS